MALESVLLLHPLSLHFLRLLFVLLHFLDSLFLFLVPLLSSFLVEFCLEELETLLGSHDGRLLLIIFCDDVSGFG